ncbi:MAG: Rpn family recombination-promoting nuclease/putative transposase [Fibrobacter sp.]|nr:Rpn family recombination-promoting nuclease/putative transposase [Fibrobacter sp.]
MATFEEKVERQVEIIKQHAFLDPTRDKVFKEIFSKDVTLIHFLNAMLHQPEERKIVSIERKKPASTLTSAIDVEEVRFDVHAKLNNEEYVDLEMQRASHEDFTDRVELYADQLSIESKIHFDSQRTETEKEDHPYLMPTTYSVWICNFPVSFCKSYREELGLFRFSSIGDPGALPVYDKKRYIVIDLSKVDAKVLNLNTAETEWLELFTKMASAKDAPKTKDPVIADVYSRLAVNALEKNFITEIATGMVTEAEISTRIGTARREGREEGHKEGCEETKFSDAEALLRDNDPVERVSRVLKLPLEKVQELADKIAAEKA